MKSYRWCGLLLGGLLMATQLVRAEQPKLPQVEFSDQKLENGLRVIIAVDRTAPVFGISVTYNVGSRNERPGRTGFAHLFEHMMFEGSENVGKGERHHQRGSHKLLRGAAQESTGPGLVPGK
jgi:predicted Zn-dependent peptidase